MELPCQTSTRTSSEGTPVPGTLKALGQAADTWNFWTLGLGRRLNLHSRRAAAGALTVTTARAKMLPLAERAVAAVTGTMQDAFWMEPRKLIETD
jgi:hypothetical protein|tara:strand:+ start:700 stop:984 length:285 start_codon:yes stop_codon:yes gene_type:complete